MNGELKPWYAIVTPHEDIRKGRFDEAVFAADLWAVANGTAPEIYLDAEEFFRKTYLTQGLSKVLNRVIEALNSGGESRNRIISLQTVFGGGKTHTLVALWHLVKHASILHHSPHVDDLKKAIGSPFPEKSFKTAVFTNHTCDSTQGRIASDGTHLHTLWGEIAFQLGGKDLYERIRANDETQRVPQGIFTEILRASSPCLILLDELADYCVGASAVTVGDSTLADQTISFIQQLTEAAAQVPGTIVVATLPASKFEIAQSEKGHEVFAALEKRFQRKGTDIKPVDDDEIFEVVRTRLFESIVHENDPNYLQKIARLYQEMYATHSGEVPNEAAKSTYRQQIERSFPFHPLLIDTLYKRWGSNPNLQRTRGVLRLLASIVGDLWQHRKASTQSQHLIQPSHIRWSIDALQASLTRLWGPQYQSVAAADIIGKHSHAGLFDDERGDDYRHEAIGEGLASTILLGSFGGQGDRSGFSSKDLKLACSRIGLNWNYTDGALIELENRCFYLHTASAGNHGKRYRFSTKPTLNKLIVQYRQLNANNDFNDEIINILRSETRNILLGSATWRILINPEVDLPEQKNLNLLILPPSLSWNSDLSFDDQLVSLVTSISNYCGLKDRLYRNTLIFLAPTSRGITNLRKVLRESIALNGVHADYWDQLDDDQKNDLKNRIDVARRKALESLGPAYTIVLRVHNGDLENISLPDARSEFQEHLRYLWSNLIEEHEWIVRNIGAIELKKNGLILSEGALRLKDAVDSYLKYTDKPIIATTDAVLNGLSQACSRGEIGIGRGGNPSVLLKKYCKQEIFLDPNDDSLWIIPKFNPEPEITPPSPTNGVTDSEDKKTVTLDDDMSSSKDTVIDEPKSASTINAFVIRGEVPIKQWTNLFEYFILPMNENYSENLHLCINLEMRLSDGDGLSENDHKFTAIKESANQLGLELKITKKSDEAKS